MPMREVVTTVKYPITLALVAIMKNEGDYIKEWLDYHILLGIKKFFLYDNGSTDATRIVLTPYIKTGIVEYSFWPGKAQQLRVYNDALEKHRLDCLYLGFIDIDEFIYPNSSAGVFDIVNSVMKKYNSPALGINWRMFGSSFLEKRPQGGVLENFVYRAEDGYEHNEHIKSLVNPRRCWYMSNAHWGFYFGDAKATNWRGVKIESFRSPSSSDAPIYINHYFTKSHEEWITRRSLGKADVEGKRSLDEFYWSGMNDIYDDGIIRLREELQVNYMQEEKLEASDTCGEVVEGVINGILDKQRNNIPVLEDILVNWYACHNQYREESYVRDVDYVFIAAMSSYLECGLRDYEQDLLARVVNSLPIKLTDYKKILNYLQGAIAARWEKCSVQYNTAYADYLLKTVNRIRNIQRDLANR